MIYIGRHSAREIRDVPEQKVDWYLSTKEWEICKESEVSKNGNGRKHEKKNEKRHGQYEQ